MNALRNSGWLQALCALILLTGIVVAAYVLPLPKEVMVRRTAQGFVPQKILIHKGDAIRFINDTDTEVWPASDFHPTHGQYPEFDPTRPIGPKSEWRFVFAKPGMWAYHDHLVSEMRGTIIVVGAPGEATTACLSSTKAGSARASCWEGDITDTLSTKGLGAAFDMFASLYREEPQFRGLNCHDAGHIIGAAAYRAYADDHSVIDRPETSYCGYGFYHGFMEAMLLEEGAGQFQKVRAYCDSLKTGSQLNNASGACYHGIGHAAFDSIRGALWGDDAAMVKEGLAVCERAALGDADQKQCSTGVFNSLANAYSARSYKLSFASEDPMHICLIQELKYQKGCYGEVGIGVIRNLKLDRSASVRFIESFDTPEGRAAGLLGYASDEVARAIAHIDLPSFRSFCTSFPSENEREACVRGIIGGLRQAGKPGEEYALMFNYCGLFAPGTLRRECYSHSISQTRAIAADRSAFQKACFTINEVSLRTSCK